MSINSLPDQVFNLIYSYITNMYVKKNNVNTVSRKFQSGFEYHINFHIKNNKLLKRYIHTIIDFSKKIDDGIQLIISPNCQFCQISCVPEYKCKMSRVTDFILKSNILDFKKCNICGDHGCTMHVYYCNKCKIYICPKCINYNNEYPYDYKCPRCESDEYLTEL